MFENTLSYEEDARGVEGRRLRETRGDIGGPQDCDGTKMFSKTICRGEQTAEGQADILDAVMHQPQRLL